MNYPQQIKKCKNMGELFDIARKIIDKKEAKLFFNAYVDYMMDENKDMHRTRAIETVHSNLGYFAGYYDDNTQAHIQNMYGSVHPIFGSIKPTPEEAFEAGRKLANKQN